jgi:hypothetical protein
MRLSAFPLAGVLFLGSLATATTDPLNYRNIAGYVASNTSTATTALGLLRSRPELSILTEKIEELGGFAQAFDTDPNWKFTFFAPNNDAFESYTGAYFDTFETAPYVRQESIKSEVALLIQHRKGKWWLGNTILHHYVPNSALTSTGFNATLQRFQVKGAHQISYIMWPICIQLTPIVDGYLSLCRVSSAKWNGRSQQGCQSGGIRHPGYKRETHPRSRQSDFDYNGTSF